MKNKYFVALLLSSIYLLFATLIFGILCIWPLCDFFLNNVNPGHIVAILTIPISCLIFIVALVLFLVYLIKFLKIRKTKNVE